jgi:hypothetical protein
MAHDDEDVLVTYRKGCSMVLVLQGNFDSTDLEGWKNPWIFFHEQPIEIQLSCSISSGLSLEHHDVQWIGCAVEDGKLGFCKAKVEKKRMVKEEKRVLSLKLKFSNA